MKHSNSTSRGRSAYTMVEMAVAVGVLGLLGLVFFAVLRSGLILSAKTLRLTPRTKKPDRESFA